MLGVTKVTLRSRAAFWFFDFLSGTASIFTSASIMLTQTTYTSTNYLKAHIHCFHCNTYDSCIDSAIFALVGHVQVISVHCMLATSTHWLSSYLIFCLTSSCFKRCWLVATIAYITLWFKARTSHASRHERSRAPDKRLAITLVMLSSHYCPQRPRSLRSTPRIATPDQVEFSVHTQSNRFVFFVGPRPLVTRMTSIIFPSTWLPFPMVQSIMNLCLIVFFFS